MVPKPLQRPHPPLWLACSRRETILLAARLGLGALTFAFVSPEESRQWVHDYYTTLENECEPVGYAVNPQIAMACPFLCDRDEEARARHGREHHGFFMYGLGHYAFFGQHEPGKTNLWDNYKNQPPKPVIDDPLASGSQSQNCIGTPDQIRAALRGFEESGVDQVLFLSQAGKIPHEMLCVLDRAVRRGSVAGGQGTRPAARTGESGAGRAAHRKGDETQARPQIPAHGCRP